jgi:hypothetical protein
MRPTLAFALLLPLLFAGCYGTQLDPRRRAEDKGWDFVGEIRLGRSHARSAESYDLSGEQPFSALRLRNSGREVQIETLTLIDADGTRRSLKTQRQVIDPHQDLTFEVDSFAPPVRIEISAWGRTEGGGVPAFLVLLRRD